MSDDMFLSIDPERNNAKPKNNPIDYEAFREFQKHQDLRYSKVELDRAVRERQDNLKQWDGNLTSRWKNASLSKMDNPAVEKVLKIMKEKGEGSFFVTGEPGSGKTFLSYAIIRKYIGKGWTTFSQVKSITEDAMLNYGYTGYIGRENFSKMFDPIYNTYFFDNIGEKEHYDLQKEIPLWERIIDHIYNNSLKAVFVSNHSVNSFADMLSDSSRYKLEELVAGRTVSISRTRTNLEDTQKFSKNKPKDRYSNVAEGFKG